MKKEGTQYEKKKKINRTGGRQLLRPSYEYEKKKTEKRAKVGSKRKPKGKRRKREMKAGAIESQWKSSEINEGVAKGKRFIETIKKRRKGGRGRNNNPKTHESWL